MGLDDKIDEEVTGDEIDAAHEEKAGEEAPKAAETREERVAEVAKRLAQAGEIELVDEEVDKDGETPKPDEPEEIDAGEKDGADPEEEIEPEAETDDRVLDEDGEATDDEVHEALSKELGTGAKPKEDAGDRLPNADFRALSKEGKQVFKRQRELREKAEAQLAELEPMAKYGQGIVDFVRQNKLDPSQFDAWIDIAAVVDKGGQAAIDQLLQMARSLGWQGDVTPSGPAATDGTKRPGWLQDLVDSFAIDEEKAKEIEASLPKTAAKNGTVDPPRPESVREKPVQPSSSGVSEEQGVQLLAERERAAIKRFGQRVWNRLRPEVFDGLTKFKGAPPEQWPAAFDQTVELVVARHRAKRPAPARTTSRGQGRAPAKKPDINKLTGRERVKALVEQGEFPNS